MRNKASYLVTQTAATLVFLSLDQVRVEVYEEITVSGDWGCMLAAQSE